MDATATATPTPTATKPPKAGRREWIGLAVLALPCLLYSMDLTVLHLAVPALSADLNPTSAQLLWILDIYGFVVAGMLIPLGTLGDRIGRRRLLLIGAAAFGVGSILAAFSASAGMLIATRALLGLAGATLAPSTLSLVTNMFLDAKQRTIAIGVWIASYSAGAAIGPVVGGILLEYFWWGSVFLIAVPVMVLLLLIGPALLPEFRNPDAGKLDLLSAAMSLTAVLAAIYGIKRIAQDGVDPRAVLTFAVGLAIGALFVRRQKTLADPLIDTNLFRLPAFSASLLTYGLCIFFMGGIFLFTGQYFQLVLGLSPLQAGLWGLPSAVAFTVGSVTSPLLVRWMRPAFAIAGGLVISAFGFALLTQISSDSGLATLVTSSVILSIGLTPALTLGTDLVMGSAPPERAGAASGISETSAEFGGALGIALLGSLGAAVYRGQMAETLPAGIPTDVADIAQDTLGGAVEAAAPLSAPLQAELLDIASAAFTQALQLTAVISGTIALGVAVLAAILLRDVGRGVGGGTGQDEQLVAGPDRAATEKALMPATPLGACAEAA
jgi:DHA2 family multidrug resistance protein-like MFS transporter